MMILTIIAMWLGGWLVAAIVGCVIFHFCLSPRRFQKRWLERHPPLSSNSPRNRVHQ